MPRAYHNRHDEFHNIGVMDHPSPTSLLSLTMIPVSFEKLIEMMLVILGTPLDWFLLIAGKVYWVYLVIVVFTWLLTTLYQEWWSQ